MIPPTTRKVRWSIGPRSNDWVDITIEKSSEENCTQSETTKTTIIVTGTVIEVNYVPVVICVTTAALVIAALVIIAILVKRRRANENEEDDETKETREDESSIPDHYADAPYTDNYYDSIK